MYKKAPCFVMEAEEVWYDQIQTLSLMKEKNLNLRSSLIDIAQLGLWGRYFDKCNFQCHSQPRSRSVLFHWNIISVPLGIYT